MKGKLSRTTALGLLAGLTAVLQLGPIYWPGAGYLLAMAAVLPTALGSALSPRRALWFLLACTLTIGLFVTEEALVFLSTTGPLGLVLGVTVRQMASIGALLGTALLLGGMLLMPRLIGIYPWGGMEIIWSLPVRLGLYTLFALGYAGLWQWAFRRLWARISNAISYTKGV